MKRRVLVAAVAVLATIALGVTASGAGAGPGPYGVTSKNVEHVKFVPFEVGTATGANVIGHYLYVTSWKSFSIYDVKNPLNPKRLSTTPFGFKFENENVSTNGKILLFAEQAPVDTLHVWDVEDKSNPKEIGTLIGGGTHTATCILHCTYDYGSYDLNGPQGPSTGGSLIDLHDPTKPKQVGYWNEHLPAEKIHDVVEIKPGMVLTASQPIMYLDARRDPLHPVLLAKGTNIDKRMHSVIWPNQGRDRFILSTFETNATPRCEAGTGDVTVWDASQWRKTHTFVDIDHWTITNGAYVDGRPPANELGCSPHWLQENPHFHNGGIVAVGYYEHGTRFLRVSPQGKLSEVGYFLPWQGSTSAAYWLTDRIVYSIDYERGIDILRYKGDF
ncbi:MAG: hypothetical protein M3290_04890 [Actinomycetota bacterium]|nr:hypothetical protein [Actinomycetota bacterium]